MVALSYEKLFSTSTDTFHETKLLLSETKEAVKSSFDCGSSSLSMREWTSLFLSVGTVCLIEEKLDLDLVFVKEHFEEEPIHLFSCAVLPFFQSTMMISQWTQDAFVEIPRSDKNCASYDPLFIASCYEAVVHFDQKIKSYGK